jgi:transcriptional regulator with GAF, ATPase, and Fis domain
MYRIAKDVDGITYHLTRPKEGKFQVNRGYAWRKAEKAEAWLEELKMQGHNRVYIDTIDENEYHALASYTYKKWYMKKMEKERQKTIEQLTKYSLPPATTKTEVSKSEEQIKIETALRNHATKKEAAKSLGMHPDTLRKKCKKLNI